MTPRRSIWLVAFCAAALCLLSPALLSAASIVARTVPELTDLSDYVVEADVLDTETYRQDDGRIYTRTTLKVARYLKGEGPEQLVISQLGGTVGELHMDVPGDLTLQQGQHLVLFAREAEGRIWPTLLGWSAFLVSGEGPQASVARQHVHLALYRHDMDGILQLVEEGDVPAPTTLADLVSEIVEATR